MLTINLSIPSTLPIYLSIYLSIYPFLSFSIHSHLSCYLLRNGNDKYACMHACKSIPPVLLQPTNQPINQKYLLIHKQKISPYSPNPRTAFPSDKSRILLPSQSEIMRMQCQLCIMGGGLVVTHYCTP